MHQFILRPGTWLGEGKIQLNMVDEELAFFTRWNISAQDETGRVACVQEIQVKGLSEIMLNEFVIYDLKSEKFGIELENESLGRITGEGVITDNVIAWEFRAPEVGFEGMEVYERLPDGYSMKAEYATTDQLRTNIQGKIWEKGKQDDEENI